MRNYEVVVQLDELINFLVFLSDLAGNSGIRRELTHIYDKVLHKMRTANITGSRLLSRRTPELTKTYQKIT